MLIYFNGDSYASGVGLADYEMIPNYAYMMQNHKEYQPIFMSKLYDQLEKSEIRKNSNWKSHRVLRELELSYPNVVGRLLNAKIINSAKGGSSNNSILHRTIVDITELIERGTKPDHVVIHITSPTRITTFNQFVNSSEFDANNFLFEYYYAKGLVIDVSYSNPGPDIDLFKWYIKNESIDCSTVRALQDIICINSFIKAQLGFYPILVTTNPINEIYELSDDKPQFKHLLKSSNITNIPANLTESTYFTYQDTPHLLCGHFPISVSNKFGEAIAKHIKDQKQHE